MTNTTVKHTAESSGSGKITAKIMRDFLFGIPDEAEVSMLRFNGQRDDNTYKLSAVWTGNPRTPGQFFQPSTGSMPPR